MTSEGSRATGISTAILALYLIYLIIPIALLFVGSVGETWSNTLLPTGSTWQWYLQVQADPSFRKAFWSSLIICCATVIGCVVIGTPMAYAIGSANHRGVRLAAGIISLLPVAAPSIVLAFGMMLVFSTDTLPLLGTTWLMIAGHVVLWLPYYLQTVLTDLSQSRLNELELAAESLGASFRNRFFDIVLPTLSHSILSGAIMVAALSIGEFQLSNLIAGFLNRTYPIILLQAFYGATGFACAATVVLLLLAAFASLGGALSARGAAGAKGGAA